MNDIKIRPAKLQDIPDVFQLVKELAIYEKAPEAVTATIEDYKIDFNDGVFSAHVALIDGKVVGTTIYYMTYSTWKGRMLYLEDFVVNDAFRRKGIGKLLFDAYVEEGRLRKAKVLKWQVLDWNTPAIEFYKKIKATIETEWWNVKMLEDQINAYQ